MLSPPQPPDAAQPLSGLTSIPGGLLYVYDDGVHGSELYRSDGTRAGTRLVRDINPGGKSSAIGSLSQTNPAPFRFAMAVFHNVAYFSANDGVHGVELWRSDGTTAGTYMVRDLDPQTISWAGISAPSSSFPRHFAIAGNALLFYTRSTLGQTELWRTDGTSAGTYRLSDAVDPDYYGGRDGTPSALLGNTLYYQRSAAAGGAELWRTDGTVVGTARVLADSRLEDTDLHASGDRIYLLDRAHDRLFTFSPGDAALTFVADIPMPFPSSPVYRDVTALNGRILFTVEYDPHLSGANVQQLWVSNGTAAGTRSLVGDTFGYGYSGPFGAPVVAGGVAFFAEATSLWRTDGTRGGTRAVHPFSGSGPVDMFALDDAIYFDRAVDQPARVWTSDGTDAGTVPVLDLTGARPVDGAAFTRVGSRLFYLATDAVRNTEVASVDLATAGASPEFTPGLTPLIDYSPRKRRLYVTGTAYYDHLTVAANVKRGRLTVDWNGTLSTFRLADVRSVVVAGGAADDALTLAGPVPGATLSGGTGSDTLTGGALGDLLLGDQGADHLLGGAGDDDLEGGEDLIGYDGYDDEGGDTLDGGAGADRLSGGPGYRDVVDYSDRTIAVTVSLDRRAHDGEPGEGDNVLSDVEGVRGGAGDDFLAGPGGALYGNAGNDTLVGDGSDLHGGDGDDLLVGMGGATHGNWYYGDAGRDTLTGTAQGDTFFALDGELDRIVGNGGDDMAHVDERRDKVASIRNVLFN